MGLDWNPGNKPAPGHEEEFFALFEVLRSRPAEGYEQEIERFHEISITAYETLNAPQVGTHDEATQWIRQQYDRQKPDMSKEEWERQFQGFYVVPLVPPCDGLPRYSNGSPGGYVEPFSFRGDFLKDCVDIIGEEVMLAAWGSMSADEMLAYGNQLIHAAERYAAANNINLDKLDIEDADSIDTKLDILECAGRWCRFWAERGHILDAYW